MRSPEHYVAVLQAIIDSPAATPGERAAARIALGIHRARVAECDGAGPVEPVEPPKDAPPVLLSYESGRWTLSRDGRRAGSWRGAVDVEIGHGDPFDPCGARRPHLPVVNIAVLLRRIPVHEASVLLDAGRRWQCLQVLVHSEDMVLLLPESRPTVWATTPWGNGCDVSIRLVSFGYSLTFEQAGKLALSSPRLPP